ncbi:thiamine pyrophosphate-binding protein [Feifania hominis]|uniref:Thiamine pyrophosphate-binding protein n=1 Tax=Feifania hominis TaxID=2763660 RepID=A0A926HVF8_9FIRM|nr:thiamine pyrophosphate-binding protein [Feifania hominis]MBC8536945.1 thiamine pyrophosphate-binding protein [Feifania hominis]
MKMTGGKAVAMTLIEQGCKAVFEVPGGQMLSVVNSFIGTDVRVIATRHENAACAAADNYGRVTGEPGVCFATTGPGATNFLTAMGGALRDGSPMIAFVFQNKSQDFGRGDVQEVDHGDIFKPICKKYIAIRKASVAPWAVREAYRVAMSGRRGPVVVDCFRDALESEEVDYEPMDPSLTRTTSQYVPAPGLIEQAADILSGYKKVAILAGGGAKMDHATDELLRAAQLLHAPVVTTHNGISVFPTDDEHSFGARTRMATRLARETLEAADCVLVVGSSLSAGTTARWALKMPDIVQIDIEPEQIARQYPTRLGLVGHCKLTLGLLNAALEKTVSRNDAERRAFLEERKASRDARERELAESPMSDATASPAAPLAVMDELSKVIDGNTSITCDAGTCVIWTHRLKMCKGTVYNKAFNFGNMGFGIPAAIGSKVARPDMTTIAFLGDGALGMTVGELETLVRENLPVIVIVINDGAYGLIRLEQDHMFGAGPNIGTMLTPPDALDYAAVARGFGCEAIVVNRADEIAPAVTRAKAMNRPCLIEVKFDGTHQIFPEAF